jgi:translation initiation factor 2D
VSRDEDNFNFVQVGSTTMSTAEALKAGLRGKALRITHYYRDLLWLVYLLFGEISY